MSLSSSRPTLPVHLVSGFLGSGKTTLINHLVQQPDLSRALVIVNEFGDIALDHHLYAESHDQQIITLKSGCICCSLQKDLQHTLRDVLWRFSRQGQRQFDQVIIETTGLADPAPILHTLTRDPRLARQLHLDQLIVTVDACHIDATLEHHPEALQQMALADVLMLTKTDLVTEAEIQRLWATLNARYPTAIKACTTPELLAAMTFRPTRLPPAGPLFMPVPVPRHTAGCVAMGYQQSSGIPPGPEAMTDWLDALLYAHGDRILRIKGLLRGPQGQAWLINGLRHQRAPLQAMPPSHDAASPLLELVFILGSAEDTRWLNEAVRALSPWLSAA
ncbi:CobW family GTP-binding protein [Larsenimonas rhizosphaerae]|uniref:GTP-binding protein n=1 Tax=Larsenimonas rhizosphaerae TaxID=2944682 RepID=A0AA41ZE04_9GAMM|nr:GTP-binding protein [Larsenimonas rhizosphaerae]MCX2523577.1 GTP-binding protein [Larsenimonas rhizosphaerae]